MRTRDGEAGTIVSRAKGTAYVGLAGGELGCVVQHIEAIDLSETPPAPRMRPRTRVVSA